MFIKNTLKKDVPSNKARGFTHEGYEFKLPPGVSAIWTSAGEAMLKNYRIDSKGGKDKYGVDNGSGLPPIFEATEAEWAKGGKKLAEVKRYEVNSKLIPRTQLIILARKRGISADRCTEYQLDSTIDVEAIVGEINVLPVPDEVKYPVNIEDDANDNIQT